MTETEEKQPVDKLDFAAPSNIFGRLLLRLHLARTSKQAIVHSALLFIAVTLIPILILSLLSGHEFSNTVAIPLHRDYITLSRYLIAAPLFILSDIVTKPWLERTVDRFASIVDPQDAEQVNKIFGRVLAFRNSMTIDLVILILAFISVILGTKVEVAINASTWQLSAHGINSTLSASGYWNAFVSQPLFRFVIFNWFVDYALWVYFLFRVSRLRMEVLATHPDGAGGLSFVTVAQTQYCVVAFALSSAICSVVAQTVQHQHVALQSFTNLGMVFLAIILFIFVGPLMFFTPRLVQTKCHGVFNYGALCHELSHTFAGRWIKADQGTQRTIIESDNPSALADLNSSFQTVISMRATVFDRHFIVALVVVTCLPAIPLVASVIPLQDLIMQIFKALS